jgi:hypothetical protein
MTPGVFPTPRLGRRSRPDDSHISDKMHQDNNVTSRRFYRLFVCNATDALVIITFSVLLRYVHQTITKRNNAVALIPGMVIVYYRVPVTKVEMNSIKFHFEFGDTSTNLRPLGFRRCSSFTTV